MGIKLAPELLQKVTDEIVVRDMDFSGDDLATGETISSIFSVTITRVDGVGMGANDLTKESQAISGQKIQFVLSKGLANVTYELRAVVITSASQTLVGCGRMKVGVC